MPTRLPHHISRRAALGVLGAGSATVVVGCAPAVKPALWQGVALGSGAELRLYHPNPAVAQSLIKRSLDEVARLEKVFSLYRDDSQIQQLNRTGSLKNRLAPLKQQTQKKNTVIIR